MRRKHHRRLAVAVLLMLQAAHSSNLEGAQSCHALFEEDCDRRAGDLPLLALNALLAGLTAGVQRGLSGDRFLEGFAPGALGGAITYAGKQVAAARFYGAGFLGREIAAVGSSVVRNASVRRGILDSFDFPIGPLSLHVDRRDSGARATLAFNLYDTAVMLYAFAEPRLSLDWKESLSSGGLVFYSPGRVIRYRGEAVNAVSLGGIVLRSALPDTERQSVMAHERVHVVQQDFVYRVWTGPAEGWAVERILKGGKWVSHIEFDVLLPLLLDGSTLLLGGDGFRWPFEVEAESLAR